MTEREMGDVKKSVDGLMDMVGNMRLTLERVDQQLASTLPHLATKAEIQGIRHEMALGLADKPSKGYMWSILGVLVGLSIGVAGVTASIALFSNGAG